MNTKKKDGIRGHAWNSWPKIGRKLVQPAFLLLALVFIGLLLQEQWAELQSYRWTLNWGWLVASMVLLLASWAVEVGMWQWILGLLGGRLAYAGAAQIWFASALARYVPGNVWQPLSMTLLCRQRGIAASAAVTSVALYQAVNLLSVLPIAAVYLVFRGDLGWFTAWWGSVPPWIALAAALPVVAFLARPALLVDAVNAVLARVKRPALPARLSSRELAALLAVALVDWSLWGGAFACLAFALSAYPSQEMVSQLPHLLASYPIAYLLGYLSFVAPSGIGVREGSLYLLLAPVMGGAAITVLALAMRSWQILLEVAIAGIVVPRRHQAQISTNP